MIPNKINVSAPGKLMLFGEHAVIYNRPCLVTAVNHRLGVSAKLVSSKILIINAPEVGIKKYQKPLSQLADPKSLPQGVRFVETAVRNFHRRHPLPTGLEITTQSQFSAKFGFGSSSAATVGTIFALSQLLKVPLTKKQIFALSYQTVLDVQGLGSGFDIAAAVYGGFLYFVTGGKKIVPLKTTKLPLIVGYTGIKADTATLVKQVAKLKKTQNKLVENIFNTISSLVDQAQSALNKNDFQTIGQLMNINQGLLDSLGVSTPELSCLIHAARSAGAYGAKLSGAGGGDCMICLAPRTKEKQIKAAISKNKGIIIDVATGSQGVKVENQ
jgi:mevalonate kinase